MATNPRSPTPDHQAKQSSNRPKNEGHAATEAAGDVWNEAKKAGADAAQEARRRAEAQGERLKEGVGDELNAFAEAVKSASDTLAERRPGVTADIFGQAATGLHDIAEALQRRSTGDIVSAIRDFGRRNPTAFIAGSVLAGVALGRFAGSSRESGSTGDSARTTDRSTGDTIAGRQSPKTPRTGG